ncbi:MAG TPA: ATP-binding protein [Candidatus Sulfotelmatobacter sp.]|nr:ATP-binding protein [Candidatus Sulfotelmatobacter sp.]
MTPDPQVQDSDRDDRLASLLAHRTLAGAPREELEWVAQHSSRRRYQVGEVATRKGEPERWLQILLAGHLAAVVNRGAGSRRLIGWRGGDVCGLLPYSRGGSPPGDTVAEEPTEMLLVHQDRFPEMIRECPRVTALLVHAMLDRARFFTSSDSHDEKLVSLGKLAAGLAHELNNPASAAARSARRLVQTLAEAEKAERRLEGVPMSEAQRLALDTVRHQCEPLAGGVARSPIERADREEALAAWLDEHRLDPDIAPPLVDSGARLESLDALAQSFSGEALDAALRSIAAGCAARTLAAEIEVSASRIHELVAAIKGFTYMDRALTLEPTDLKRGIVETVTVLGGKARAKSVAIDLDLAPDLPRVPAFGGELNQVWANLLDNALDAVGERGRIEVTARRERDQVVVEIVDDGPGIPADIRSRIFDPFFTTKPVGSGTGLGLDIVHRLVLRHEGDVEVDSRPGRTTFRVSLPLRQSSARSNSG